MAIRTVTIIGTGLIGTSVALAMREAGFDGTVYGIDRSRNERSVAMGTLVFNDIPGDLQGEQRAVQLADVVLLAAPVLAIMHWTVELAPVLREEQLVTDVGSTKAEIALLATRLFNQPGRAGFLPGHPMAGKEHGGAAMASADLFRDATWLFTPIALPTKQSEDWRQWVQRIGARTRDMEAERHDELCAWVSHLPQFLSTAMASLLEARFGEGEEIAAIGGRALREVTRLGASPYSMWRDIAITNNEAIGLTIQALEQELAYVRENLRTPGLREEFARANRLRLRTPTT